MTKAYIVTDLGYGDCGKGTIVDYLSRQRSTVVVRHNGGPQAAHNVITPEGRHHTFSQFGSGTFGRAKTFLSRFMLVNPLTMFPEWEHLVEMGVFSTAVYVDENAMLITPWHVAINRLQELARGHGRHGSCGQGVGAAMAQDVAEPSVTLRVKDIAATAFANKVEAQRSYLAKTFHYLRSGNAHWSAVEDPDVGGYFAERCRAWQKLVSVVPSSYLAELAADHEQLIFEGAQGVLLDEWFGFHPYTTWSTCTHENALTLLREIASGVTDPLAEPVRLGVIRAVTTRHGPGPHPTEDSELTASWVEPHNGKDPWQGGFRVGHLDLVAHRYAVSMCGGVDQIAVTHLDRGGPVWRYCPRYQNLLKIPLGRRGDLAYQEDLQRMLSHAQPRYIETGHNGLLAAIEDVLSAPVTIASYGPTAKNKVLRVPEAAGVLPRMGH